MAKRGFSPGINVLEELEHLEYIKILEREGLSAHNYDEWMATGIHQSYAKSAKSGYSTFMRVLPKSYSVEIRQRQDGNEQLTSIMCNVGSGGLVNAAFTDTPIYSHWKLAPILNSDDFFLVGCYNQQPAQPSTTDATQVYFYDSAANILTSVYYMTGQRQLTPPANLCGMQWTDPVTGKACYGIVLAHVLYHSTASSRVIRAVYLSKLGNGDWHNRVQNILNSFLGDNTTYEMYPAPYPVCLGQGVLAHYNTNQYSLYVWKAASSSAAALDMPTAILNQAISTSNIQYGSFAVSNVTGYRGAMIVAGQNLTAPDRIGYAFQCFDSSDSSSIQEASKWTAFTIELPGFPIPGRYNAMGLYYTPSGSNPKIHYISDANSSRPLIAYAGSPEHEADEEYVFPFKFNIESAGKNAPYNNAQCGISSFGDPAKMTWHVGGYYGDKQSLMTGEQPGVWICPKSGVYKVICVGGGEAGTGDRGGGSGHLSVGAFALQEGDEVSYSVGRGGVSSGGALTLLPTPSRFLDTVALPAMGRFGGYDGGQNQQAGGAGGYDLQTYGGQGMSYLATAPNTYMVTGHTRDKNGGVSGNAGAASSGSGYGAGGAAGEPGRDGVIVVMR